LPLKEKVKLLIIKECEGDFAIDEATLADHIKINDLNLLPVKKTISCRVENIQLFSILDESDGIVRFIQNNIGCLSFSRLVRLFWNTTEFTKLLRNNTKIMVDPSVFYQVICYYVIIILRKHQMSCLTIFKLSANLT